MSILQRLRPAVLVALAVLTVAVAAVPGAAEARTKPNPVNTLRLSPCTSKVDQDLGLFAHRLGCGEALKLMASAVNSDRRCPRHWVTHTGVRPVKIDPVSSGYPALTLCSETTHGTVRAFAYILPGG